MCFEKMLWGIIFVPSSDKLCLWGGISDSLSCVLHVTSHLCHFICQVAGGYLTAYLGTSSHISSLSLHLSSCWGVPDSLSRYFISHLIFVTSSAKLWGGISEHFICFKWALIDNMDQQRTLILAVAVSYGGYIGRMSSENLNSFQV